MIPNPSVFIKNFSPLNDTDLYIQIVDESGKKGLKDILKRVYLMFSANPNDIELEKIWRMGIITTEKFIKYLRNKFSDDHLRCFEYVFEAECLNLKKIKKQVIVDMGGGFSYSTIVPAFFRFSNSRILSVDVLDYPRKSKFGINYVTGDCMNTRLRSSFADVVTLISTLEHVGLGRYGDPFDPSGDIKAMKEAKRILKKGGYLILTIPYGYPTVVYNIHRVYDEGRFKLLAKGFKPVRLEYTLLGKKCRRKDIEGKKVNKNISGYYNDVPENKRIYDAQGGILALLQKI